MGLKHKHNTFSLETLVLLLILEGAYYYLLLVAEIVGLGLGCLFRCVRLHAVIVECDVVMLR
jgi:hypothetical protein